MGTLRISAVPKARRATPDDLGVVAALLTAYDVTFSEESLSDRISAPDSGVVLARDVCASWTLDAGVLHAYDIAGDLGRLGAVVAELDAIANEAFAAVLSVTTYDDDPASRALLSLGFLVDWDEADVRAGVPTRLVGLVREVPHA